MDLKENETIKLSDGFKYWIVKKIIVENITFYYTIKIGTPAEVVVFADRDGLEVVDDEVILNIVNSEVAKSIQQS